MVATMEKTRLKFGAWFSSHRIRARYSARAMGTLLGYSNTHIANIEKGKTKPTEDLVRRFASLTGADVEEGLRLADLSAGRAYVPDDPREYVGLLHPDWDESAVNEAATGIRNLLVGIEYRSYQAK